MAAPHTTDEQRKQVADLVKDAKVAVFTTVTADGSLVSRPLAVQDAEFDGDLWFFTQDPSEKVSELTRNTNVNAAMEAGGGWLSISGKAELVHDRALVDRYWSKMVEAWFPEGKDDPTVALIKVHAESAEYWVANQPKVVLFAKLAASAVTGNPPDDVGENETVDL